MRAKLFLLSSLLLVSMTGLLWYLARSNQNERSQLANIAQSKTQVAWLAQSAARELRVSVELAEVLAAQAFQTVANTPDTAPKALPEKTGFVALAKVARDEASEWRVLATVSLEPFEKWNWVAPYLRLALQALEPRDLNPGDNAGFAVTAFVLISPDRRPFQVWLTRQGSEWLAAVSEPVLAMGLLDRARGAGSENLLLTQNLQVLAHTNREYVGSSLASHGLYRKLIEGGRAGEVKDPQSNSQLHFERVAGTNLLAVDRLPTAALKASVGPQDLQLWLIGLGFLCLLLVAVAWVTKSSGATAQHMADGDSRGEVRAFAGASIASDQVQMVQPSAEAMALVRGLVGPIKRILGRSHVLQDKAKGDRNLLLEAEVIEEGARKSYHTLQKVLEIEQTLDEPRVPTSLAHCLRTVLLNLRSELEKNQVEVKNELTTLPGVLAIPIRVQRIFECLIENSIEAMEKSPIRALTIRSQLEDRAIKIEVIDTGQGVKPEELAQIFSPFVSLRREGHAGLGLAVVKRLTEQMGMQLELNSQWGKGTTVTLQIPLPEQELDLVGVPIEADLPVVKKAENVEIGAAEKPEALQMEKLQHTLEIVDENLDDLETNLLGEPVTSDADLPPPPEVSTATPPHSSTGKDFSPLENAPNSNNNPSDIKLPRRKPRGELLSDLDPEVVQLQSVSPQEKS